ncbi:MULTISPECIES: DUF1360 domain-containing protein [Bacillaceae]|uniref:DUF1360 domain-containing protein n=1 Tax=Evansella alkalicola TaxID=745819 RepID=A0ABS6JYE5_9BACI|nr:MULTISPECIES: DUF1360 domain-containing protein [Bacillaceae]MBU9723624.1 DUF1360 domain-containing protein [Bacillus alkalicola]
MTFGMFHFVVFSLAVARLTHLFVYDSITEFFRKVIVVYEQEVDEDGNEETVIVINEKGWRKWLGELITCHWCMGIWSSIILWIGYVLVPNVFSVIIIILAAAGLAAIIESIIVKWLL